MPLVALADSVSEVGEMSTPLALAWELHRTTTANPRAKTKPLIAQTSWRRGSADKGPRCVLPRTDFLPQKRGLYTAKMTAPPRWLFSMPARPLAEASCADHKTKRAPGGACRVLIEPP